MNDIEYYDEIPFSDELFPIKILWNRRIEAYESDSAKEGTWHEQLEILYFLEGDAIVYCGTRKYECHAGDIIIVNPCEKHYVKCENNSVIFHCFMIDTRIYGGGDRSICDIKYITPLSEQRLAFNNKISGNAAARHILECFIGECERTEPAYEVAVKGYILLLLSELLRHELRLVTNSDEARSNAQSYEQIEPALRIISAGYSNALTLSGLAGACHMTPSYYCRRFKAIMKMTTTDYINEYRISKAELLLSATDLSISQIALRSGFSDSAYFSRLFHALRGISPSAFRTQKEDKE